MKISNQSINQSISAQSCKTLLIFFIFTFIFFQTIPCRADLQFGLVGWWRMQDGAIGTTCSGASVSDSSGKGNTGTCNGSPTWVLGPRKESMNFNGTNQYISLPGAFTNGLSIFSVSVWVQTTTTSSISPLWQSPTAIGISSPGAGSQDFQIIVNSGKAGLYTGLSSGGGDDQALGSIAVNDGKWHLIVASNNGTICELYVDGVAQTSLTTGMGLLSNSYPFYIGTADSAVSTNYFSGSVDDVRIYNRALSAQEVTDLYNNGASINNASLNNFKLSQ